MQHCKAKTKSGAACRAPAGPSGFCFFHANPDKAQALGQIGGRKNRFQLPEPPAASSLSAADLTGVLAEAIRDVRSNKMAPRTASALSQLCNSAHRILQTADVEARLARLEQQLVEQETGASVKTDPPSLRGNDETHNGADVQTGDVSTPTSGKAEATDDESAEGGEA